MTRLRRSAVKTLVPWVMALSGFLFADISQAADEKVYTYHARSTGQVRIGDPYPDTAPAACEKRCSVTSGCAAYKADASVATCALFGGFTDSMVPEDPYNGVEELSGVFVGRVIDRQQTEQARRAELAFLDPEILKAALRQRGDLPAPDGETFAAVFEAPDLQDVETLFGKFDMGGELGESYGRTALDNTRKALAQTRASADWRRAAVALSSAAEQMTEIGDAAQKSLIHDVYDMLLSAAVNSYLLAVDDFERAASLAVLAAALFQNDRPDLSEKVLAQRARVWADGAEADLRARIFGTEGDDPPLTRKDVERLEPADAE
jgi:hypothetical protein